jgi:WNK lysine deficient protein kinase
MVLSSLVDTAPPSAPCVCSPPVSEGPGLPPSLPSMGTFQQPVAVVSMNATPALSSQPPCLRAPETVCEGCPSFAACGQD